jgi:hypothetical protein
MSSSLHVIIIAAADWVAVAAEYAAKYKRQKQDKWQQLNTRLMATAKYKINGNS